MEKKMMEDKKLNEQESLELITRMIQNSKKNMELGSGNIFLLWGYLSVLTAAVVMLLVWQTGILKWNWLWFAIPLVGWPLQAYLRKKEERPVLTYTDRVISSVWGVLGLVMGVGAVIYCTDADVAMLILPIMVLCAGIGVAITGSVINDKWMKFCGTLSFFIALFALKGMEDFNLEGWYGDCVIFIVCIMLMFIVPGHRLNCEARRLRKEEGK